MMTSHQSQGRTEVSGVMRSRPWQDPTPLVEFTPLWLGQFDTFDKWVNHATRALTGYEGSCGESLSPICIDAFGRRCNIGKDFMRARDEGAFPIRYFIEFTPIENSTRASLSKTGETR